MKKKFKSADKAIVVLIALCLISMTMIEFFGVMRVSGSSMYPTYKDGDIVSANRYYKKIDRNDVIIFYHKNGKFISNKYIKRVIAIPGDTIQICDEMIYINGKLVEDEFGPTALSDMEKELLLDSGEYFVMGDNRDNSEDSRDFGPVQEKDIIGVVN